jgi:hypothetical protein
MYWNASEFVKAGCILKLYDIVAYAIKAFQIPESCALASELLLYAMKTFTVVSYIDRGRDEIVTLCPAFVEDLYTMLSFHKAIPVAVHFSVNVVFYGD